MVVCKTYGALPALSHEEVLARVYAAAPKHVPPHEIIAAMGVNYDSFANK